MSEFGFDPGMHSYADQAGFYPSDTPREHNATEVGRIVARYIADTTSFQRGNALVRSEMAATSRSAGVGRAKMAQYSKYGVLAVGAALVGSLKSFANYDRAMNVFQANTDASTKTMKSARDMAVKLGADARFPAVTAAHVADVMVELSKAGLTAKESIQAADSVMLLGTAGQMEFADAAKVAANSMNAFELGAKDLPKLMDYIAGAALKSSTEVSGVAEAFRYTSTFAHKLDVPMNQVTTMIGLLSNAGLEGDMAGTSLRMFFTSLTGRSKKAIEEMKGIGLINKKGQNLFFDKDGTMKDFDAVGKIWRRVTAGMKPNRVMALERDIFGVRGSNVAAMLDKMGKKGKLNWQDMFTASTKGAGTKQGAASKLAEANTKGLYGAYQRIVNVVQTLGLQIGEKLAPTAIKVLNAFSKLAEKLSKNKRLIDVIAKAILITIGAFIAWKAIMITTAIVQGALTVATTAFGVALTFLRNPLMFTRFAMLALNTAIAANPIGAIIIALIAVVLVLRHFGVGIDDVVRIAKVAWTKIRHYFNSVYGAVKHALTLAINWVKRNWPYIVGAMLGPLGLVVAAIYKNWGKIKALFGKLKTILVTAVKNAFRAVVSAITGFATAMWDAGIALGKKLIDAIVSGIKSAPGKIVDAIASQVPGGSKVLKAGGWLKGKLATGGYAYGGQPYLVGERGPELFIPGRSGNVVPNHALGRAGGGPSVNIENMNVASVEDPYVIASVLERRMAFAQ